MNATMLLVLAWRNVWRNPLRSLVLIASVVVGLWAGLFVIAFYQGMSDQRLRGGIEEIAHIQIHASGFDEDDRASLVIPGGDSTALFVGAMRGVQATGRSLARGMLATARSSVGVEIRGVDPASEDPISRLENKIAEGGFFGTGYRHPVAIGRILANKQKLKPGSKLVLTFQDAGGNMVSGAFRVAGVYRTSDSRFDESTVFVPRAQLDALLGLDSTAIHEIALRLENPADLEAVASRLRSRFPSLQVRTWKQVSPDLELIASSFSQVLFIFMGIILLGLAFGIVNTMLMAVLERTREIGMLMALGMRRRQVFSMILGETVLMVLVGTPIGFGLAALTIACLGRTGIDLSRFGAGLGEYGMDTMVYPALSPLHYAQILGLVAATAVLAAVHPARQALKSTPADAIRAT